MLLISKNTKRDKKLIFFKYLLVFNIFFSLFFGGIVGNVSAETSPYRSAGWVATDGNPAFSSTLGCQMSNDGQYCSRSGSGSGAVLYFGSFGSLDDFGIPINSTIDKLNIRVKGKSSGMNVVSVIDAYNKIPFNYVCQKPSELIRVNLGSIDSVVEIKTIITPSNGLSNCINANNINIRNLTFAYGKYIGNAWSADIDNFEIAFDYTPPAVTPPPVVFPEGQKGTVWEMGPDKSNLAQKHGVNNVISIVTSNDHSLALKSDGTVWAWGRNDYGQLGNGSSGGESNIPAQVKEGAGSVYLTKVKAVAGGQWYSLALKEDGTVWAWGFNGYGYRGTGVGINDGSNKLLYPTQVKSSNFSNITAIVAGGQHSLALNKDGSVISWGLNTYGQIGTGCCGSIKFPTKISNITDVAAIAAGREHSLAVKNDGTVWGWGRTSEWQLGESVTSVNSFGERPFPQKIPELNNIKNISSGLNYNLAITTAGTVLEWGGDYRLRKPREINGILNTKSISAKESYFSFGVQGHVIKEDGTLWQLYINDVPPKQVPYLKDVVAVASGDQTPALAVINSTEDVLGDSIVKPFLDLPWDYGEGNFEKQVYNPESWFDHEYPLQNILCCVQKVMRYDGLEKTVPYRSHAGYDYASKNGVELYTPVRAAADGFAEHTSASNSGGLGDMIKIDHGNGYQTWYGHLDPIDLIVGREGETKEVKKGDEIGKTGFTGNIFPKNKFGAHIHFGVFKDTNGNGSFADDYPVGLVDPLGWEGKEKDPWTEHPHGNSFGSASVKLFANFPKPTQQVIPKSGGELKHKNVQVKLDADTLPLDFTIHYKDGPYEYFAADNRKLHSIAPSFFLEAFDSLGDQITKFLKPIVLTYDYSSADLSNTKEETLKLHYFDILQQKWIPVDSVPDLDKKLIIAETDHFTQFAVFGEIKDAVAPSTTASLSGSIGQESWYRSFVGLKLISVDNEGGSGVDEALYSVNNDTWKTYLESIIVGSEGDHKISFQSSDKVGNIEDVKEVKFRIDKTSPITTASASGTLGLENWHTSDVTVELNSEDNLSGIDKSEYSINNGETYQVYESEIAVSKEGAAELLYRSIDKAGNVEEAKKLNLKIDKSAPSTVVYTSGSRGVSNWYRSNVVVELSGHDQFSGYSSSYYSIDGGENYVEFVDQIILSSEGEHKVFYYSVDIAGNVEEKKSIEFRIDKTAPVVLLNANPTRLWPVNGKMVDVRIGGGVDETNPYMNTFVVADEYNLIEPDLSNFNQFIKLQARRNGNDRDGRIYRINFISEDLAGNKSEEAVEIIVPHDQR